MSDLASSTIAAIIGAGSGLLTNYIGNFYLGTIKEFRSKRMEIAIKRVDEQIGKFYAPLLNLVEQLNTIANLKDDIISHDRGNEGKISKFMYDVYFLPIHDKIAKIIEPNLHLIEGDQVPDSFKEYNEHVASERVFFSIVESGGITANFVPHPYPPNFYWDIKKGFETVNKRQEKLLKTLDEDVDRVGVAGLSKDYISAVDRERQSSRMCVSSDRA